MTTTLTLHKQTLHLHPLKVVYWQEQNLLMMADLHLGKSAHFRKRGVPVPSTVMHTNFKHLQQVMEVFTPERVLFLGDLFHSTHNLTWQFFEQFLERYAHIQFELVKGNHDILPADVYEQSIMQLHIQTLSIGPFLFSHYPLSDMEEGMYNFHGHIHPGVCLEGSGKQVLKLPCFHFGSQRAVLPAFGEFTGLAMVQPMPEDLVFVIAEDVVMEVSGV